MASNIYVHHLSLETLPRAIMMYRCLLQLLKSLLLLLITKCNPLGPLVTCWKLLASGLVNYLLILKINLTLMKLSVNMSGSILMMTPVMNTHMSSFMYQENIGTLSLLLYSIYISGFLLMKSPPPICQFMSLKCNHLYFSWVLIINHELLSGLIFVFQ